MKMSKQQLLALAILATIACGAEVLAQDTPPDPAQQAIEAEQAQQAADAVQQELPGPPQAPMPCGCASWTVSVRAGPRTSHVSRRAGRLSGSRTLPTTENW